MSLSLLVLPISVYILAKGLLVSLPEGIRHGWSGLANLGALLAIVTAFIATFTILCFTFVNWVALHQVEAISVIPQLGAAIAISIIASLLFISIPGNRD